MNASQKIAKEMQRVFGGSTQVVKIKMLHEDVIRKYVMRIEEGRNKPAKNKLPFGGNWRRRNNALVFDGS